eukprot:1480650-Pyramimonas_sp.AAC.3
MHTCCSRVMEARSPLRACSSSARAEHSSRSATSLSDSASTCAVSRVTSASASASAAVVRPRRPSHTLAARRTCPQ